MQTGGFCRALMLFAWGALLATGSAQGATTLQELRYGASTTVVLGTPPVTLTPNQIANDLLAGPVYGVPLGTIPDGVNILAYHRRLNGDQLLVLDSTVTLSGTPFSPRDVIRYDGSAYTPYFSGASQGIPDGVRISGVALVADATLLLSFDQTVTLSGITFKPNDIAQWNGAAYSLFFDSAAQGVPAGNQLQDFHYLDTNAHLLLSFDSSGIVGGITFDRADILEYTPGAPGNWEINYHGVGHAPAWAAADLTALWAWPRGIAAAPSVVSTPATGISQTGASLNGTVNDQGAATTVSFQWGTTTAYGQSLSAAPVPAGAGLSPETVAISGLACNTTYHFRITGNNGVGGTQYGNDLSFITAPCGPAVVTNAATAITQTAAVLNGTVSAQGASTTTGFDFGLSLAYGNSVAATPNPVPAAGSNIPIAAAITGLRCNTPYNFRATANNSAGAQVGGNLVVTTSACAGATAATATLLSSINPSAFGQTVSFTATVSGATVPTGTVSFYDGATLLGSGLLNPGGQAILSTAALAVGSHPITAHYNGDATYAPATSQVLTQAVTAPMPVPTLSSAALLVLAMAMLGSLTTTARKKRLSALRPWHTPGS